MENDLICFCYNYTAEDIRQDYQKNGRSVILEKIQEKHFDMGILTAESTIEH